MDAERQGTKVFLEGPSVGSFSFEAIPVINGKLKDTAIGWVKQNPIGPVDTVIGRVEADENSMRDTMDHTKYKSKISALPSIKTVLEKGAFLGVLDDLYGQPVKNYYFAAPVDLDGQDKIVFVR
ncbi:MAG: cytochrome P450 [Spirochaetaceae bacterium]|jgi:hypothetical protein|nr:cytochrome P450 [Spirochaetaceae bacterium]